MPVGGAATKATFVLTDDVRPILEAHVALLGYRSLKTGERAGHVEELAAGIARIGGFAPDTAKRMVWRILQGPESTVSAHHADVDLLACGNHDSLRDLPHFPRALPAAHAMLDAYLFVREARLTAEDFEALAGSLLRFSQGFLEAHVTDEERAKRDRQNRVYKNRRPSRARRRTPELAEAA